MTGNPASGGRIHGVLAAGPRRSPFDDIIEVTLTADGEQTLLTLEVQGLPLETTPYYGAGWQIHAENLAAYITGRAPVDGATRAQELVPSYLEMAVGLS